MPGSIRTIVGGLIVALVLGTVDNITFADAFERLVLAIIGVGIVASGIARMSAESQNQAE